MKAMVFLDAAQNAAPAYISTLGLQNVLARKYKNIFLVLAGKYILKAKSLLLAFKMYLPASTKMFFLYSRASTF